MNLCVVMYSEWIPSEEFTISSNRYDWKRCRYRRTVCIDDTFFISGFSPIIFWWIRLFLDGRRFDNGIFRLPALFPKSFLFFYRSCAATCRIGFLATVGGPVGGRRVRYARTNHTSHVRGLLSPRRSRHVSTRFWESKEPFFFSFRPARTSTALPTYDDDNAIICYGQSFVCCVHLQSRVYSACGVRPLTRTQ